MSAKNRDLEILLRRIFSTLQVLETDFEGLAFVVEANNPPLAKKIRNVYNSNKIRWVKRDLLTTAQSQDTYETLFEELNSERLKDLNEWYDIGIRCSNLEELLQILRDATIQE